METDQYVAAVRSPLMLVNYICPPSCMILDNSTKNVIHVAVSFILVSRSISYARMWETWYEGGGGDGWGGKVSAIDACSSMEYASCLIMCVKISFCECGRRQG